MKHLNWEIGIVLAFLTAAFWVMWSLFGSVPVVPESAGIIGSPLSAIPLIKHSRWWDIVAVFFFPVLFMRMGKSQNMIAERNSWMQDFRVASFVAGFISTLLFGVILWGIHRDGLASLLTILALLALFGLFALSLHDRGSYPLGFVYGVVAGFSLAFGILIAGLWWSLIALFLLDTALRVVWRTVIVLIPSDQISFEDRNRVITLAR